MNKKDLEKQSIPNAGPQNYMAPPTITTVGVTNDMKAGLTNEGNELSRPMEYEAGSMNGCSLKFKRNKKIK